MSEPVHFFYNDDLIGVWSSEAFFMMHLKIHS